jgi:hypothetical protein
MEADPDRHRAAEQPAAALLVRANICPHASAALDSGKRLRDVS